MHMVLFNTRKQLNHMHLIRLFYNTSDKRATWILKTNIMSTISFVFERTITFCTKFAHISKVDIRQSDHVHTFSNGMVFH